MNCKIFCDESNHTYSDTSDLMVIGGILCLSKMINNNDFCSSIKKSDPEGKKIWQLFGNSKQLKQRIIKKLK